MSWYEIGIDEIITKLVGTPAEPKNLAIDGVSVERLKEYNDGYTPLLVNKDCQVFVGVPQHESGTKNESTERDSYTGSQDTDIYFTVSVASRELYGTKGIYGIGYKAIRWLTGLPMSIGGHLTFFKYSLVAKEKNVWYYQIILRIRDFPVFPFSDQFPEEGSDVVLEVIDYDSDTCKTKIITNLGEDIIIPTTDGESTLIK